jgi:hypothetical protein
MLAASVTGLGLDILSDLVLFGMMSDEVSASS